MTGLSASCDSFAACAGVSEPKAGAPDALVPPACVAVAASATAGTPPSRAEAVADMTRTDKNLRFAMLSSSRNSGLSSRDVCDGNRVNTESHKRHEPLVPLLHRARRVSLSRAGILNMMA